MTARGMRRRVATAAPYAPRSFRSALRCALLACLLLLAATATPGLAQPPAFTPQVEDVNELPPGPGRDDAFYSCTACHAFKLVAQQGLSRAQWDETIELMIVKHNMPPLDEKQRKAVLEYLATTYPPRRGPGGWQNPFLGQ
jgi:hypothetical protein